MDKAQGRQYFVEHGFLLYKAQPYQKFTVKKEELNITFPNLSLNLNF